MALALLAVSALLMLLGAGVGSTGWESVWAARSDPLSWQIVTEIRLPRTAGAWLAGGLLGLAGAIAQGVFRNPLADPYLLGSASGASLGVALSMAALGASPFALAGLARLGVTGAAFAGAALAVLLTLVLAQGVHNTMRLLLAGVVVGVVLGAAASLVLLMNLGVPVAIGLMVGDLWGVVLLGGLFRLVWSHHTTFFINSLAHIWGSRPYTDENTARDNPVLALFTYGEGYHNFHHIFQNDYRNGVKWWQYDPTKWLIATLSSVRLAGNLKRVPDLVRLAGQSSDQGWQRCDRLCPCHRYADDFAKTCWGCAATRPFCGAPRRANDWGGPNTYAHRGRIIRPFSRQAVGV